MPLWLCGSYYPISVRIAFRREQTSDLCIATWHRLQRCRERHNLLPSTWSNERLWQTSTFSTALQCVCCRSHLKLRLVLLCPYHLHLNAQVLIDFKRFVNLETVIEESAHGLAEECNGTTNSSFVNQFTFSIKANDDAIWTTFHRYP
jgi:hypothetical protein